MGLVMKCLCCGVSTILEVGANPTIVDGECIPCFEEYKGDYTKHPRNKESVCPKKEKSNGVLTTNGKRTTSRNR